MRDAELMAQPKRSTQTISRRMVKPSSQRIPIKRLLDGSCKSLFIHESLNVITCFDTDLRVVTLTCALRARHQSFRIDRFREVKDEREVLRRANVVEELERAVEKRLFHNESRRMSRCGRHFGTPSGAFSTNGRNSIHDSFGCK